MDEFAALINQQMMNEMASNAFVEPLTIKIDNTRSADNIERARQALIAEKEEKNRSSIGSQTSSNGSAKSSGPAASSASSSSSSSGGYRSYSTPYGYQKSETEEEKARKFANKCAKAAINKAGVTKSNWDIVSAINADAIRKRKTPDELRREQNALRWKKTLFKAAIAAGKTLIELLYLKGGRRG